MELAENIMSSTAWLRLNQLLLFLAYVGGFGALLFAASFARWTEDAGRKTAEAPWPLIVGTMRDSFLITMLYLSESLFYHLSGFAGAITGQALYDDGSVLAWIGAIFHAPLGFLAIALGVFVAGRRLLILSRWLRAQG